MEPKVHACYSLIHKPIMCTTRGERKSISIRCQKECVESKLDGQTDSHRNYSIVHTCGSSKISISLKYFYY